MSEIGDIRIECEDDGFHLVLTELVVFGGEPVDVDATLDIHLPADAAIRLLTEVMEKIAPWHTEGQSVLRDFEEYRRTGVVPMYVPRHHIEPGEVFDLGEPDDGERLREAVDQQRKSRRENP